MTTTTTNPTVSPEHLREAANLMELAHRAAGRADALYRGEDPDEDLSMFALLAADAINCAESGETFAETACGEDAPYILAALRVLTRGR